MEETLSYTNANSIEDVLARQCQCPQVVDSIEDINTHPGCPGGIEDIDDIIGALDYNQPSGKHICELEEASQMFKNDLFLVSQLSGSRWVSRKAVFKDLKSQLLRDLAATLDLGSMAREDKDHWALTSHNHNAAYNKVEWHPNPDYAVDGDDVSCLAVVHISTETLTATDIWQNPECSSVDVEHLSVNCPAIQEDSPPEPLIGTLRFVSSPTLKKLIDTNSLNMTETQVDPYGADARIRADFDGWVFPNGTTIVNYLNQLSDAALVFAGDQMAETFTVPALSSFFQSCGIADGSYSIAEKPQTIGLARHQHDTDGAIELTCDIEFNSQKTRISSTTGCGGKKYVHQGGDSSSSTKQEASIKLPVEFNDKIVGLETNSSGDAADEQYCPAHNLIPVMIYIGGVLKEHYSSIS